MSRVNKFIRVGAALLSIGLIISGCRIVHESEDPASKKPTPQGQQQYAGGKQQETKTNLNPLLKQEEFDKVKKYERNHIIYNGPKDKKQVALTFDDGPDPRYTKQVLEILKQNDIKATFFLIGQHVKQHPDLVKQEIDEGHTIASHSWEHKQLPKLSPDQLKEDLNKTRDAIKEASGKEVMLMRPPYGDAKGIGETIKKEGFLIVNWDVDTNDWRGRTPEQMFEVIQKFTGNGSIILHHDGGGNRSNTVSSLNKTIQTLKSKGFEFVTVDQMLGIRPYAN
ncbi:polysaccharide deacetylase family protein [Thermoflavimicrobium daqui]|uniref:polysaccharide deacetylase family protein n=1 Tax=Thermoflavimicrobium daqui TaxID=2137476 RepID=UPI00143D781A|nr:polysaccharide deacetylase family protein [Thermoflavimicrobium daqui]